MAVNSNLPNLQSPIYNRLANTYQNRPLDNISLGNVPIGINSLQNPYQFFTYTIPAGGIQKIEYAFSFMRVYSLSDALNTFFRFDDSGNESRFIGAGVALEFPQVAQNLYIRNGSGGNITVELGLAIAKLYDDRLNVSGNVNVVTLASPTFTVPADVALPGTTTTLILAANTSRRTALIKASPTNGGIIKIGESTAGASRGFSLAAGEAMTIDTTAAIYAYNSSAVAGAVEVGEI